MYSARKYKHEFHGNNTQIGGRVMEGSFLIGTKSYSDPTTGGAPTSYSYDVGNPVTYKYGDEFDVSRSGEIDAAIQSVAFDRWREENSSELENTEIYKEHKLEIEQLQEDIRAEWEQLTSEDENGENLIEVMTVILYKQV